MEKQIYIVEGCHISQTKGMRDHYEYQFNHGCYATEELAQKAIEQEISKLATRIGEEYEIKGSSIRFVKGNDVNVWRFRISTISYEF